MFVTWGQRFSCLFLFPVDCEASQGNWDSSKSFPMCQMLKSMYKFVFNTFHSSIRVSYWPCPIVLSGMQHRAWWTSSLPTRILLLLIMLPLKLICIDKHFFFLILWPPSRNVNKKYWGLQDLHIYCSCNLTFPLSVKYTMGICHQKLLIYYHTGQGSALMVSLLLFLNIWHFSLAYMSTYLLFIWKPL